MKPRILLVNWRDIRNPEAGGAEIYFHEIFRRLAGQGYSTTVLAHGFSGASAEEEVDGLRVVRVGGKLLFNYAAAGYIRRHRHDFDLVIEDINKIAFFTPLYWPGARLHLVMHFFGRSIFREAAFPLAAYVYLMERLIPPVYARERFVAISDSTRREVERFTRGSRQVDVVEPGVDTGFFHSAAAKSSEPLLVFVGRLRKYKNVQFLIRHLPALRRQFPGLRLAVGGDGEYSGALQREAAGCGVEDATDFLGRITEAQKRDLLSRATLFVNPSVKEGWGISNIEANACGTVSVSSDVPGLRDSVCDGDTGVLFRYGDGSDYLEKVSHLLQDAGRRREMETRAAAHARTYSWDAMTEKMEAALQRAVVAAPPVRVP